jgi:hypothetical protein
MCQLKRFTPLFTRICRFQEVGQLSDQTALQGDEEGAIQNVPGDHSDDCHSFLTISDIVLNVSGLAGGKKQASRHQPQSGGLPVGAGGGKKNDAPANFAEALRQWLECCKRYINMAGSRLKKAKNKCASIYNCSLFIEIFRKLSKHTP